MYAAVGLVTAAMIGVTMILLLVRGGSSRLDAQPWLLYDAAKQHVTIMGGLAGFAVTGVVLLVGLLRAQPDVVSSSLDTVVVMFVVAYFYYVGNAFLISYLPHRDVSGDLVPAVHFSLASTIEYRTLFVSWFALMPLLQTYGLDRPAAVLIYLLPASMLLGSVVISTAADGLGLVRLKETYLAAAIGTALALFYAAGVHFFTPQLRSEYSALYVTITIFAINGAGFAIAAATSLSPRYAGAKRFYLRFGRGLAVIDMQLTMTSLPFLWLAVVGVI